MLLPQPLKQGDLLGIVAPAGMLGDESLFHAGIRALTEMGFEAKFPRQLWPGAGYLADCDDNRAAELNSLFADPEVKGLVALRGGYGCLRILDKIDLENIASHPKLLVGFSDITVLQNYLYHKTGLVSLHGPTLTSLAGSSRETVEKFHASLLGQWTAPIYAETIAQLQGRGRVTAPLIGGNLASLITVLGTKYDSSWAGTILFLEDVNEPLYKVDRMLTQLAAAGKFSGLKGIILGDFSPQGSGANIDVLGYKQSVWNRIIELCPSNDIPVWANFPAGHCAHNITFPLGVLATMDCSGRTLTFA